MTFMVCRPHQYIIAGIASGGARVFERTYSLMYDTKKNYERKPEYSSVLNYNSLADKQEETLLAKQEEMPSENKTLLEKQAEVTATYLPVKSYVSTANASVTDDDTAKTEKTAEESMEGKKNEVRAKKQLLAQKIMAELEKLGPREEHTHGELTHVH